MSVVVIVNNNRGMNDASQSVKSQTQINTVDYLLKKQYSPQRRKVSQYNIQEPQRPNFVLRHAAKQYTVVRVYINSLESSQIRLYYSKFTPRHKEATICIVHGYGESTDDYIEMAEYFARNRFVVNMIDLRSFGYSGGRRVNQSIRGFLSDIQNLLRRCCEIGLPTYVLSHGFGSLLVLALLEENPGLPLSGVIALSPLFAFPFFKQTSLLGKTLMWTLSWIYPDLLINNMINPTSLTNNDKKVKDCIDGVFSFQFITIQMVQQYHELSEKAMKDAHKFQYPLFVGYGAKNVIQPKEDVKRFYQLAGSKEKSSCVFKNGFHQLYKDEGAEEEVYPKILDWILDLTSNKNQIKWGKTGPFNITVIAKVPNWIKYMVLAIIPILIGFLLKIRRIKRMTI